MKKSGGFVQIIALIIIFVVVVLYLGKSPLGVWNDSIKPFVLQGFEFIVRSIEFIIKFVTDVFYRSR